MDGGAVGTANPDAQLIRALRKENLAGAAGRNMLSFPPGRCRRHRSMSAK